MDAITIFLSAFLLFQVQLILGKALLPWFGGTPAVWTTCMMFFQVLLLLGYAYAHGLTRRLGPRSQAWLHAGLVLLSAAALCAFAFFWHRPLLPSAGWRPDTPDTPVRSILLLLALAAGLPYFVLSATSPLLQRWLVERSGGQSPYRLYAVSNAGSLAGLVTYPFLVEPFLSLDRQAWIWTILYAIFMAGVLMSAWRAGSAPLSAPSSAPVAVPRPAVRAILIWLLLSTCSAALLLAFTHQMCQEIGVVPLLWVLPLALYLLSFIICFDRPHWYRREIFLPAAVVCTLAAMVVKAQDSSLPLLPQIVTYSCCLFALCMTAHGEIVMTRPAPAHLTLFYLAVAAGGALGGTLVAAGAPAVFPEFWESKIILFIIWTVLALAWFCDRSSFFHASKRRYFFAFLTLAGFVIPGRLVALPVAFVRTMSAPQTTLAIAAIIVAAVLTGLLWRQKWIQAVLWPRLFVGLMILYAGVDVYGILSRSNPVRLASARNFYGVVSVNQSLPNPKIPPYITQVNGRTIHGFQFTPPELRRFPAGYCSPGSGVGLAFRFHPRRQGATWSPLRVGVAGLGVGAMASYMGPRDSLTFFEINRQVVTYSAGRDAYFRYIDDCPAAVNVEVGDARLLLEQELAQNGPRQYDLLVLDAFSSDSVPVHLLTIEAFDTYLRLLRGDDSIIAVNITNRFLDLRPLLAGIARHTGMTALFADFDGDRPLQIASSWVLLTKSRAFLEHPEVKKASVPLKTDHELLWTDTFSNVFRLLRR